MAAVDYFLKIDGIEGESADSKHPKEIQVLSFSFGESQSGTMAFGGSDTQALLPGAYTFLSGDKGTHSIIAILHTAGSQSIEIGGIANVDQLAHSITRGSIKC